MPLWLHRAKSHHYHVSTYRFLSAASSCLMKFCWSWSTLGYLSGNFFSWDMKLMNIFQHPHFIHSRSIKLLFIPYIVSYYWLHMELTLQVNCSMNLWKHSYHKTTLCLTSNMLYTQILRYNGICMFSDLNLKRKWIVDNWVLTKKYKVHRSGINGIRCVHRHICVEVVLCI